jgi:holo-[acyl-carrier protein] synthase
MILGIGIDIIRVSRIASIVRSSRYSRFTARVLHPTQELPILQSFNNDLGKASQYLASTWAAKESLYKSLDEDAQKACYFNQWYRCAEQGKRIIKNDKYPQSEQFLLSISHDGDLTTAFVVRQQLI